MDRNPLHKLRKNGSYYRKKRLNREKCELFLKNTFSGNKQSTPVLLKPKPTIPDAKPQSEFQSPSCSTHDQEKSVPITPSADDPLKTLSIVPSENTSAKDPIVDDNSCSDPDVHMFNDYQGNEQRSAAKESSREALQKWAIGYNISHQALKGLLGLIKLHYGDESLPNDPRTLLATSKNTNMHLKDISGGQYWHQGLEVCLRNSFKFLSEDVAIELNINIDGLPIYKSAKDQLWPILYNVHGMPHIKPMAVGMFLGKHKPLNVREYLTPFVDELKTIVLNGLIINGHSLKVKVRCFVCDSPARAFLKSVVSYNGIDGCLKCTTLGEYSHISRTVTFPTMRCAPRTDEGFRKKQYGKHHKFQDSPILEIPGLDTIKDFVVADSLHLLELGIMKRCLVGWKDGSFACVEKMSASNLKLLSVSLLNVKLPTEIHRSMRGLDCVAFWKGVEWRSFLIYVGIVLLKDILEESIYNHFVLLFVAVTICSVDIYKQHLSTAQLMFETYIEEFINIYGSDGITSNVHNLEHVVSDVQRFGPLPTISAYPFENSLFQIKKLLRQGYRSLEQIANRIMERNAILANNTTEHIEPNIPILKIRGKIVDLRIKEDFMLSNIFRNAWFMTRTEEIVRMLSASYDESNNIVIHGKSIKYMNDFFVLPIRSSFLHIYVANKSKLNCKRHYKISDIFCKLVAISYNDSDTVFIPLHHTIVP